MGQVLLSAYSVRVRAAIGILVPGSSRASSAAAQRHDRVTLFGYFAQGVPEPGLGSGPMLAPELGLERLALTVEQRRDSPGDSASRGGHVCELCAPGVGVAPLELGLERLALPERQRRDSPGDSASRGVRAHELSAP